jgi:hypothetical protein
MSTIVKQKTQTQGEAVMDAVIFKPSPFRLDPRIRDYFNARIDAVFAPCLDESNDAIERATKILWDLDAEQRELVDVLARGLGRTL